MTIASQDAPSSVPRVAFTRLALDDMAEGLRRWPLWATLAWADVRQRYKRSIIGPFWITFSLGLTVLGLGIVYSALFHQNLHDYLPYICVGFIAWGLISSLLSEGCFTFIHADSTIKQIPFPLSTFAYRQVCRNVIVLMHNLLIYVIVIAVFGINPGPACLLALPGVLLIAANGLGFAFLLGVLSARFRDIPQLVANVVQLVFFITPILWQPQTLGNRAWVAHFNPFTYLIDVVRQPLLGMVPSLLQWEIAIAFTILNLALSVGFFVRYRWRIPYWL